MAFDAEDLPPLPAHYSNQCSLCGSRLLGLTDRYVARPLAEEDCCTWCHRTLVQPALEKQRQELAIADQDLRVDAAEPTKTAPQRGERYGAVSV